MDMSFNLDVAQAVELAPDTSFPGYDPRVTSWLIAEICADLAEEQARRRQLRTSY